MNTTIRYFVTWGIIAVFWLGCRAVGVGQDLEWTSLNVPGQPSEIIAITGNGNGALYAIGNDRHKFGITGIYKSEDEGASWTYVGPDPQPGQSAAFGTDIDMDADSNLYHVDRNTLKSEDGGKTWQELSTEGGLFASDAELQVDSQNRLYIRKNGDNGIFLSKDSGENWNQILSPGDDLNGMYVDGNDRLYAYGEGGLQVTSDQGSSWSTLYDKTGVSKFLVGANGRLIIADGELLSWSDDDGSSWTEAQQDFRFKSLGYDGDGTLFAASANAGVKISTDGGETWSSRGDGLFEPRFGSIQGGFFATGSGKVLFLNHSYPHKASGAAGLYVYNSENKKWDALEADNLSAYVTRDLLRADGKIYAVMGLRPFVSDDGGKTWQEIGKPSGDVIEITVSSNGDIFLGTTTSVHRSTDGGETWEELQDDDLTIRASELIRTDSNIIFGRWFGTLLRFNNDTDTWTDIGDNLADTPNKVWYNRHNQQLYVESASTLYTTEDNGDNWVVITDEEFSGTLDGLMKLTFEDASTFYAITPKNLRKTTDGGETWTEVSTKFQGQFYGNADISRFVAYGDEKLVASVNQLSNENFGVHVSEDGGASWNLQNESANKFVSEILNTDNKLYIGTAGSGILTTDISTGTNIEDRSEITNRVALHQNYPNPFNPSTMISFQLPRARQVQLEVYDLLGQRVAVLLDRKMKAGTHQITFNAGNQSSGFYLYRLRAGNEVQVRKMLLLK